VYLGELSGVPEFKGGHNTPWTQGMIDARWKEISAPGPAPLLPPSMVGLYLSARPPRTLASKPNGGKKDGRRAVTRAENDFLNFWGKVAVDPYRKQSGISKVAGGILQVASFVFPALSTMTAVAEAGNAALSIPAMKADMKLLERIEFAPPAESAAPTFVPPASVPSIVPQKTAVATNPNADLLKYGALGIAGAILLGAILRGR
jgi:hypothetical protein